ncbi:Bile acid:sodium symporter family-containing protein [Strongyloides ratti]|uniref:Bile acid:sodium symporter family-containing protein n=1 Tax=Strongyloides ratti TaxID=34506 RepID=A0A090L143_STRRB|nr:Bile acid:sodium symporter family-containing protein [Strongyloides ratti]CEF63505.1 Bile acid:sodium symporter family-containing protein [Strongyloides ratti]
MGSNIKRHALLLQPIASFDPVETEDFYEGDTIEVKINKFDVKPSSFIISKVLLEVCKEMNFLVYESSFKIISNKIGTGIIKPILIGMDTNLHCDDCTLMDIKEKNNSYIEWIVNRKRIFVLLLIIIISLANIMMGCEIDLNIVWETIKKPYGVIIGFVTQFLLMPMIAIIISLSVFWEEKYSSFALGLFITACSPGGGASNYWTILLSGNANLSVTMTFFSSLASLFMMPLWISQFEHYFYHDFNKNDVTIKTPFVKIITSLLSMIIPLLIGVLISKKAPKFGEKIRKVTKPFLMFVLVFLIVFGCISSTYIFHIITIRSVFGSFMLPFGGFMFGCFMAIITRQPPPNVTAIAIETGVQNTGIAILVLKAAFRSPQNDIACLIPILVACCTPIPLTGCFFIHGILNKFKKFREKKTNIKVEEYSLRKDRLLQADVC